MPGSVPGDVKGYSYNHTVRKCTHKHAALSLAALVVPEEVAT